MCTLTFTGAALRPDADPGAIRAGEAGYALLFNRDELRTRGPEIPPAEARTPSGVRYVAPTDSDAGGTWIASNEFGVTVALLNGYIESRGPARDAWTSRGALVRSLADMESADDLWQRMSPRRLAPYRPSVVVALGLGERPVMARWDGLDVVFDPRGDRAVPISSSSYRQHEVQTFRRELYHREVLGRATSSEAEAPDVEALQAFHRWVGDDGPGPFSPSMAREDAATRSQCTVHVRAGEVRFDYLAGAPHDGGEPLSITLRTAR